MEDNQPLGALPLEIKLNIFSRLPVEWVLGCKLVSRAWRWFLQFQANNTTYFSNLQLEHYHGSDSKTMSFIGFKGYGNRDQLWYLEYYDDDGMDERPNYRIRKMNLELPVDMDTKKLVGSDNGLICLTVHTIYRWHPFRRIEDVRLRAEEPLYICNPVTREFVTLPGIVIDDKKSTDGVHIVCGFGYNPQTNEYKVVRICCVGNPKTSFSKGRVEVYTLGSGKGWRHAGDTNYYFEPDTAGVCVNGALHWFCPEYSDIVAFDLADEEFRLLPTPYSNNYCRRLFVMGQCLCAEYQNGDFLELWLLKKNNEDEDDGSMNEQYYRSWSWVRELSVPNSGKFAGNRSIFLLTKKGEYLLTDGDLVFYNQGIETSPKWTLEGYEGFTHHSLPHINSLVSLEALGEKNVKKLEAARST